MRPLSLTRTLKGWDCRHLHHAGGDTGLREMKPLVWGQRVSERDEGPLQTCTLLEAPRLPERLPVGPRGLRLAQELALSPQKWGDISAPSFLHAGLGLLQAPDCGGSLPLTQPGPFTGEARPLVGGEDAFLR